MSDQIIWIVDDDPMYRTLCTRQINQLLPSARVTTYEDGTDCLDALVQVSRGELEAPDLVLLDSQMPYMDGWELLEAARLILTEVFDLPRIAMISAATKKTDRLRMEAHPGVWGFFDKPLSMANLQYMIDHFQLTPA